MENTEQSEGNSAGTEQSRRPIAELVGRDPRTRESPGGCLGACAQRPGTGPAVSEGGHSRPTGERALVREGTGGGLLSGPDRCSESLELKHAQSRFQGGCVVAVCWWGPCWHSLSVGSWGAEPGAAGIPLSGPRDPGSLLGHILPVGAATWMTQRTVSLQEPQPR